jgi:acyl-CoA thioester hydrolase
MSEVSQFFAPLSFPELLTLGLRVNALGTSSVSYEVGVFQQGKDDPAAVGGYTHVFVDSHSRKSTKMGIKIRDGLEKLLVTDSEDKHARAKL